MITLGAVVAGYFLDGLIGDPPGLPHPVRGIGWLIARLEPPLRRTGRGPRAELAQGLLLTLLVVGISAGLAWLLVWGASRVHPWLGAGVTAVGVAVLLARRSLAQEAGWAVWRPLAAGDLPGARQAVSRVVGRDTAHLDAAGVARAAVETLAENASDGVVAPLLFALLGGLPGIAAYKAINTLDSMIGHKDSRYLYFGRAAAQIDDLANWLPARLTCLGIVVGAALLRRSGAAAWHSALAGAPRHPSPNAGWPEAAMAGALGIQLGGVNYYDGESHAGPVFNPGARPAGAADIPPALELMAFSAHLSLVLAGAIRALLVALPPL